MPDLQEIVKAAAQATFLHWWVSWQRQNAEAYKEMVEKHGVEVHRTPNDILITFLETYDKILQQKMDEDPLHQARGRFPEGVRLSARSLPALRVAAVRVRQRLLLEGRDFPQVGEALRGRVNDTPKTGCAERVLGVRAFIFTRCQDGSPAWLLKTRPHPRERSRPRPWSWRCRSSTTSSGAGRVCSLPDWCCPWWAACVTRSLPAISSTRPRSGPMT